MESQLVSYQIVVQLSAEVTEKARDITRFVFGSSQIKSIYSLLSSEEEDPWAVIYQCTMLPTSVEGFRESLRETISRFRRAITVSFREYMLFHEELLWMVDSTPDLCELHNMILLAAEPFRAWYIMPEYKDFCSKPMAGVDEQQRKSIAYYGCPFAGEVFRAYVPLALIHPTPNILSLLPSHQETMLLHTLKLVEVIQTRHVHTVVDSFTMDFTT